MTERKQNNQEGIKKVTIIANEEQYKLAPFVKKCSNSHKETLMEFIYETGINIRETNIYRASSQELAFELVEQGFFVLLYNSQISPASLTIYLPEELSIEQKQYLEIATSMINQCDLIVFKLDSNEELFEHQKEASKNTEALISYIKTLPESKIKNNNNNNNKLNKLIKNL